MVRSDIYGMLKTALQRGKNIPQTVQSLVNSGYPKEEVDEAMQSLNMQGFQPPANPVTIKQIESPPKEPAQQGQTKQIISAYPSPPQSTQQRIQQQGYSPQQQFYYPQPAYQVPYQPMPFEPTQKVSDYNSKKPNMGKMMIIIMLAMLFALIGILVIVFMFKPELENFINNL